MTIRTLTVAVDNFDSVNTFRVEVEGRRGPVTVTASLRKDFEKQGDGIYWALMQNACLKDKYSAEDMAEGARLAAEKPLRHGDVVMIDGLGYKVEVKGKYQDCAMFRPIPAAEFIEASAQAPQVVELTADQIEGLTSLARIMQRDSRDYMEIGSAFGGSGCPVGKVLINFGKDGVWLCENNSESVSLETAKRLSLILATDAQVLAVLNSETPQPALSNLQAQTYGSARAIADAVDRQLGASDAGVAIAVTGGSDGMAYLIYTRKNGREESTRLLCSATSMERLAAHVKGFIENIG